MQHLCVLVKFSQLMCDARADLGGKSNTAARGLFLVTGISKQSSYYGELSAMTKRVVITGIGMVSPVGLNRTNTWKHLLAGESGIDHISSFDTDGLQTTFAAVVKGFDP